MRRNRYLYILLYLIAAFSTNVSCKKKTANITIEGSVKNTITNNGVPQLEVKLFSKEIQNNTYSNSFNLIEKVYTDYNGNYKFSYDHRTALEYKIEIKNIKYFDYISLINPDNLKVNEVNTIPIVINPKSYLKLRIKNQFPVNNLDNIVFNSNNTNCPLCFNPSLLSFNGQVTDTTLSQATLGQRFWKYSYYVTKNNFTQPYTDSIYCEPGDTSYLNIFY